MGDSYIREGEEVEKKILCYKNALRLIDTDINLSIYLKILLFLGDFYGWNHNFKKALRIYKLLDEYKEELNSKDQCEIEFSIFNLEKVIAKESGEETSSKDSSPPTSKNQSHMQITVLLENYLEKQSYSPS